MAANYQNCQNEKKGNVNCANEHDNRIVWPNEPNRNNIARILALVKILNDDIGRLAMLHLSKIRTQYDFSLVFFFSRC